MDRGLVEDTMVALASRDSILPLLRVLDRFEAMSNLCGPFLGPVGLCPVFWLIRTLNSELCLASTTLILYTLLVLRLIARASLALHPST